MLEKPLFGLMDNFIDYITISQLKYKLELVNNNSNIFNRIS